MVSLVNRATSLPTSSYALHKRRLLLKVGREEGGMEGGREGGKGRHIISVQDDNSAGISAQDTKSAGISTRAG